ncbi:hypothetical protein [Nonomuraea sp. NPDC050786]|uniref:hypothetical protein n=1 Tax=Nonomuraea sp. NPDC050786 TaxID=3154840 RepID=UPI0033D8A6E0
MMATLRDQQKPALAGALARLEGLDDHAIVETRNAGAALVASEIVTRLVLEGCFKREQATRRISAEALDRNGEGMPALGAIVQTLGGGANWVVTPLPETPLNITSRASRNTLDVAPVDSYGPHYPGPGEVWDTASSRQRRNCGGIAVCLEACKVTGSFEFTDGGERSRVENIQHYVCRTDEQR